MTGSDESHTEEMKSNKSPENDIETDIYEEVKVTNKNVVEFQREMDDKDDSKHDNPQPNIKEEQMICKSQSDVRDEINDLYQLVPEVVNHFLIADKIGEGAFSSVFLARLKHYPEVNEMFALKHIIPTTHPSRIENELRCLLKIGGRDNVMGVKLCLRNRDNVVIVMSLFQHDKFQDYLHLMDVNEAREYMRNLLIALRRVHQFKVIHRDVKPSNFLYNRQLSQYSLVDFGLASGSFLIDRDKVKHGNTETFAQAKIFTSNGHRIPLSPSKWNERERNAASIAAKYQKRPGRKVKGLSVKSGAYLSNHPTTSVSQTGLCNCLGKPMICSLCVARNNQMAPRAGTAGFRSPEVLMKFPEQDTAVDIWAAGVIFLSILSARYPFFRAQDDLGYLAQIISILGSNVCMQAAASFGKNLIMSERVPQMDLKMTCMKLRTSQMSSRQAPGSQHYNTVQSWTNITDEPFDLLAKMLDPNPKTRICAEEALKHPFFGCEPLTVPKSSIL